MRSKTAANSDRGALEKRQLKYQRNKPVTKEELGTEYIPDEFQVKSFLFDGATQRGRVNRNRNSIKGRKQFVSRPISTCGERCTGFATRICHRKLCSSKYLFPVDISDSNRE
jgi:hypothetical protein